MFRHSCRLPRSLANHHPARSTFDSFPMVPLPPHFPVRNLSGAHPQRARVQLSETASSSRPSQKVEQPGMHLSLRQLVQKPAFLGDLRQAQRPLRRSLGFSLPHEKASIAFHADALAKVLSPVLPSLGRGRGRKRRLSIPSSPGSLRNFCCRQSLQIDRHSLLRVALQRKPPAAVLP